MKPKIFISYRRNDSAGYAYSIYHSLKRDFTVFFDIEGIEYGDTFPESIQKGIERADVLLAVVGTDSEEEFQKRLEKKENDYVASEIAYAYKLEKSIIPLLVGGATMPNREALPHKIDFFSDLNAYTIHYDKFATDVENLKIKIYDKYGNYKLKKRIFYLILTLLIICLFVFFQDIIMTYLFDNNSSSQSFFHFGGDIIDSNISNIGVVYE